MAEDGGTFLEDFINSTELLPNDIRRNSELIRELDKDATENAREIEEAEVIDVMCLSSVCVSTTSKSLSKSTVVVIISFYDC